MDSTRERLITCFAAVFPRLAPEEALGATVDTTPEWDSSHHFLLMQVIEDAFGIQIPEEAIGEIESFAAFENYLAQEDKLS